MATGSVCAACLEFDFDDDLSRRRFHMSTPAGRLTAFHRLRGDAPAGDWDQATSSVTIPSFGSLRRKLPPFLEISSAWWTRR